MKKLLIFFLGVIISVFSFGLEYENYDLLFYNDYDFSDSLVQAKIDSQRTLYEQWLEAPESYSKGQTGLMILEAIEARDTLAGAVEYQRNIMSGVSGHLIQSIIAIDQSLFMIVGDTLINQYELIDNLYDYISQGYGDSLMMVLQDMQHEFEQIDDRTIMNIDSTKACLNDLAAQFGARFDTLVALNEPFTFTAGDAFINQDAELDTNYMFTITNETVLSIDSALFYLNKTISKVQYGIKEIVNMSTPQDPAIDTLISGVQDLISATEVLNNEAVYSLIDSSLIANVQSAVMSADSLLNGKAYPIDDEVSIIPINIVRALPYGLYQTFADFYWQTGDLSGYTFRDIIPTGLPAELLEHMSADMVIDPRASYSELEAYLTNLGTQYAATVYFDPSNINAQVGLGYIGLIAVVQDMAQQGQTIYDLVKNGRVDSLFQQYNWNDLDYTQEIGLIRTQLNYHNSAALSGDTVVYTILIKDPNKSSLGTTVIEGDRVFPVYIIPRVSKGIVTLTYRIETGIDSLKSAANYLYTKVDSVVDIDLDPNLLDLSDINEPLDLIDAFQASNPNFLAFTPEGKVKFQELGQQMTAGFLGMGDMADTLTATMLYAENLMYEFGMTEGAYDSLMLNMAFASNMVKAMAADMADPETYTYMGLEPVNMSAWFDDVPDNLLEVMKNYYEGTDSSMAGFFPNYIIEQGVEEMDIPAEFSLKSAYPNPFNPVTNLEFDIPSDAVSTLEIYDLTGRCVETILDNQMVSAGTYKITWNASQKPSGIYIARMSYSGSVAYQKMTLLK